MLPMRDGRLIPAIYRGGLPSMDVLLSRSAQPGRSEEQKAQREITRPEVRLPEPERPGRGVEPDGELVRRGQEPVVARPGQEIRGPVVPPELGRMPRAVEGTFTASEYRCAASRKMEKSLKQAFARKAVSPPGFILNS